MELTYANGKLIGFNVSTDQLSNDWFQGPASTDLYYQRATEFVDALVNGSVDQSYDMMHPALQEQAPKEKLEQMTNQIAQKVGKVDSQGFTKDRMNITEEKQILVLSGEVVGDQGTLESTVEIQFIGLKGHLIAFNFTDPPPEDASESANELR